MSSQGIDYVTLVKHTSREHFADAFPCLFLFFSLDLSNIVSGGAQGASTIHMGAAPPTQERFRITSSLRPGFQAVRLDPKALPDPGRAITVGRVRTSDIVVPIRSVSKLHATIEAGANDELVLRDHGSKNGTRVNDRRLDANQACPIKAGDAVAFGDVVTHIIGAGELYDLIQRMLESQG